MHPCTIACSARADDIRNYLEIRLDKENKLEGIGCDLLADFVRIILENISDMCAGEFGVSSLSAAHA